MRSAIRLTARRRAAAARPRVAWNCWAALPYVE